MTVKSRPRLPRPYWLLWSGATATSLGDGIRLVAFPLLAAGLTSDAAQIASITVATYLPALLIGPVAGVIVDRSQKRNMILTANVSRAAVLVALSVMITAGGLSIPALCGFAFVYGAGEALEDPASHAILPRLVSGDVLGAANSRLQTGQILAEMFIGRAAGGILFALAAWTPMLANTLLLLLAASFVAALPPEQIQPVLGQSPMWRDIRDGITIVARSPLLSRMSLLVAFWSATSGAFWGVATVYALEDLRSGPTGYGILLALSAVGSLAGATLAVRVVRAVGAGTGAVVAMVLSAGSVLALGFTRELWLAAALLAANGFGVTVWNVISVTVRQANVPLELLGRTSSTYRILSTAFMPVGAALAGLTASATSPSIALIATGVMLAAAGCLALPRLRPILSRSWPRTSSSAVALDDHVVVGKPK